MSLAKQGWVTQKMDLWLKDGAKLLRAVERGTETCQWGVRWLSSSSSPFLH